MDKYNIAKYIRLSSEDTKSDSMSIGNQRLMIDKFIADMDIPDISVTEFVDNGFSGTNFERPSIQKLLELVNDGKINCIIVKDFSRFGRNAIETGYLIEKIFPLYRVRFISICDRYDSDEYEGGTGGVLVALKFLVNESYSRDLSKKIKAAKRERMLRGEHIYCALGYVKTKDNKLEIDPGTSDIIQLIFKLVSEGNSLNDVKEELYKRKISTPSSHKNKKAAVMPDNDLNCVWTNSSLLKILRDEQYIGTYVAGKHATLNVGDKKGKKIPKSEWIRIAEHHPAIISVEVFEKVQEIINFRGKPLKKNNREIGTNKRYAKERQSILKGKVVCGCCGHTMSLSVTKNAAFKCTFTRFAPDEKCYKLHMPKIELENTVSDIIRKQGKLALTDSHLSEVGMGDNQTDFQSECELLIGKASETKRDLYEQFMLREITAEEYMRRKIEIDDEIDRLNQKFSVLNERFVKRQSEMKIDSALREVASCGLSAGLVETLIEKVVVYPDMRVEVQWKVEGE